MPRWAWCGRPCCSASSTPAWRCGAPICSRRSWAPACARPAYWCCAACWAACWRPSGLPPAAEDNIYADEIIFARDTRYQHIVLTRFKDDLRLFLNSHLQFSSRDEYRYHESLVHPGLAAIPAPRRVLVLGGGDGLAVREILKYPQIESVTLVDLDPEMTRLFSTHPMLTALNQAVFLSPKVHVVNADAFPWIDSKHGSFDFIVVDFPDPDQLCAGQALHHGFLSRRGPSPERAGPAGGAEHIAYVRPRFFLVHREHPAPSGTENGSLPCLCAVVWGVGIRHSLAARLQPADEPAGGPALSQLGTLPALFQFPPDMARWRCRRIR